MFNWFFDLFMEVTGNDNVGWCAKYTWDKNHVWASSKNTAIFGCRKRRLETKA